MTVTPPEEDGPMDIQACCFAIPDPTDRTKEGQRVFCQGCAREWEWLLFTPEDGFDEDAGWGAVDDMDDDQEPLVLSDAELTLLNNALGNHLLALDATSPTFDRDVDEALALKGRIDGAIDDVRAWAPSVRGWLAEQGIRP